MTKSPLLFLPTNRPLSKMPAPIIESTQHAYRTSRRDGITSFYTIYTSAPSGFRRSYCPSKCVCISWREFRGFTGYQELPNGGENWRVGLLPTPPRKAATRAKTGRQGGKKTPSGKIVENRVKLVKTCAHRFKHLCGFLAVVSCGGLFRHRKNQSETAVLRFLPFG